MSDAQQKIRELHQEILTAQKKKKDLGKVIRDAQGNYKEYADIAEQIKKLRERKKQLDAQIRNEYSGEFSDIESVKIDIKDSRMVLSDLIWNELAKNHSVEIVDEDNNRYVPQVIVTLKRER